MLLKISLTFAILSQQVWSLSAPPSRWPPAQADPSAVWDSSVDAGPLGRAADDWLLNHFRSKMLAEVGLSVDDVSPGFKGVVELAHILAKQSNGSPDEMRAASRRVLQALFPDFPPAPPGEVWLLSSFRTLFAAPVPAFSTKLVAAATALFGEWLMGPIRLTDLEDNPSKLKCVGNGQNQLVQIKRCRFLEEAGCASICVNSCKMPTQDFFNKDMGVPCTIVPNYDDLSCQFQFGYEPTLADELEARSVPCFDVCPVGGRYRSSHDPLSTFMSDDDSSYCSDLFYEEVLAAAAAAIADDDETSLLDSASGPVGSPLSSDS